MPRTPRPILDVASGNLLAMIAIHQDRPCPTDREIRDWTGVARHRLRKWLKELEARGIVEIGRKGRPPGRRRMRAVGGSWTGWTQRGRARC
jgi:DNA-binding MarR family transcriptional regulator